MTESIERSGAWEQNEDRSRRIRAALYLAMVVGTIAGVGLVGGFLAALSGCSPASAADQGAPAAVRRVATAVVATQAIAQTEVVTGTVVAHRSSSVAADAPGKVTAVYVERGARVVKGQPLVRLDSRGAVLGAREARAQRAAVDGEARLARVECGRSKALYDQGAITRAQYDRETTACASASEQAAAAAARVNLADKAVGDGVVRAPFDGVVVERRVQVGEYVRADSRLIDLVDPDPLRLELTAPESMIGRLAIGRQVHFTTSGLPGRTFRAAIDVLGPAVDRAGRSLVIEAQVDPATSSGLLPGMFATARVEVGQRTLPSVPRAALRRTSAGWRVFTVVEGALEERIVQLADASLDPTAPTIPLLRGVAAGERVVASADDQLQDGARVE